jgi:hypothetical protein
MIDPGFQCGRQREIVHWGSDYDNVCIHEFADCLVGMAYGNFICFCMAVCTVSKRV